MKEFNLELAKAGHSVQTRDGKSARIVCDDVDNPYSTIIALVYFDGKEFPYLYDKDGYSCRNNRDLDLFMATTKKEGFVNIYGEGNWKECGNIYESEEEAKSNALNKHTYKYITTTKIEWEE